MSGLNSDMLNSSQNLGSQVMGQTAIIHSFDQNIQTISSKQGDEHEASTGNGSPSTDQKPIHQPAQGISKYYSNNMDFLERDEQKITADFNKGP